MAKTKVGILGSGDVAKALGSGFIKYDYEVMLGTRNKSKNQWSNAFKHLKLY